MISSKIQSLIAESLKNKDEIRLSTLRMLSSAFNYERIEKQHELSNEEELVVIRKEAKKRKDAIEAYTKANAPDKAEKEALELKILEEFLPAQMSDSDLEKIVEETIEKVGAKEMKDMGKVIGTVMASVGGKAEASRVANLVKEKLTK